MRPSTEQHIWTFLMIVAIGIFMMLFVLLQNTR